ncbi:hypothetical protein PV325_001027 [Microctonus aethiopoides]|uniref:Poly [ADP-ribose] polymerase n=1 Tax=Microctonus aethiopoides TaxID=144406 RepID=A0AA39EZL2_9HYME|nr:hypothetical protein PV326_006363 [Microctonus aethiopoides]KAK0087430.1 hypothetical protein PV325_001027 [Microctonus aethiopoides]KAK0160817.1 hypothetical protein PV328_008184 [Microctonus aethiopoides]
MGDHLPFRVEYAKTGRASCKSCKSPIAKDSLRLAKIVQSPFHDGVMTNWFHSNCFFLKSNPRTVGDIGNFDNIRWEDQQMIKEKIESCSTPAVGDSKSRKRPNSNAFKDYKIEYAKSNRSVCIGCEAPIIKDQIRISKKDYDSEKGAKYGGIDRWHHSECFAKIRDTYNFFATGDCLPGFKTLQKDDKALIKKLLPEVKNDDLPPAAKKIKVEKVDSKEEKTMKDQNKKMYDLRDQLSSLSKKELISLLDYNAQYIPQGESNLLDMLCDSMTFGALSCCAKCSGQLKFRSGVGYKCRGDLTEWTKCEEIYTNPKRTKFIISPELKERYEFLKNYKPKVEQRLFQITAPSTSSMVKKEDTTDGPKVDCGPLPLRGMQFVIAGKTTKNKDLLKTEIMKLGGTVTSKVNENTAAVIGNENAIKRDSAAIEAARKFDIQVVSEDFVDEAKDYKDTPISLITKKNICDWGGDPTTRVNASIQKSSSRGKSMYEKSSGSKIKLQVKGGGAVDPDSGLEDIAHVYQCGDNKYTVTLGITDIQAKKNSFYKLQILKHDNKNKYWLFRSWGRIGTSIGGNKLDNEDLDYCIAEFERLYEEKSGNEWRNRKSFVKKPHMLYPLDIDDGLDDSNIGNLKSNIESQLKKPVQDLLSLIFDINMMKKLLTEYEIDTEKMPLGKLSKKQLQQAYSILTELQQIINRENPERMLIVDASNRFYTLVPHNFGIADPPLLDNDAAIKAKCEMLDALIEMEIAYNLLSAPTDNQKNPLDAHYEQLKTDIDVLDKSSEEFKIIQQYTKNTHGSTHAHYDLEIDDVFVIKRRGEEERYKPFKKLSNKKLLWHGSRTTNYAGILSQGLRIAPPEAPVTGYMFGKGIYFADMVSKSANYCCTNATNSTGLLLLCEVACGKMYERTKADYIEKLPKGYHSTFGMGRSYPDPASSHLTKDKVEIPYGLPITRSDADNYNLLYNEYIVYDVAQVKAQYLVRMKFNYKF